MWTITDLRNFFGKRMNWIMMALGLLMLLSMGAYFGGRSRLGTADRPETDVFAVIDGQAIPRYQFDYDVRQLEDKYAQQGQRLSAITRLRIHAAAIQSLVAQAVQEQEAKRRGIDPDDDMVLKMADAQFDVDIVKVRDALVQQKSLAPNATDKAFKDAFRKQYGRTIEAVRKQNEDKFRTQLQDQAVKQGLYRAAQEWALQEQFKRTIKATAADYERSLETVELAKVYVSSEKHKNAHERINEAEKLIKQGTPFDQVADQLGDYEVEPVATVKNKPKKSYGGSQPRSAMEIDPTYKDVADKPLGYVSPIRTTPDGLMIYKILSVKKGQLPADYATNQYKYVREYRNNKADQAYTTWINEKVAAAKVEIKSKPWALLYKWQAEQLKAALTGAFPSPADQEKQAIATLKEATALVNARRADWTEALLLQLSLSSQLAVSAKDIKAKSEAAAIQKQAVEKSVMAIDDPAVWMQAAQQFAQDKEYSKAVKQLIRVSQSAYSETNPQDQDTHWKVQTMLTLIQAKGYAGKDLDEALSREAKYQARAHEMALKQQALHDKQLAAQRALDARRKADEQKKKDATATGTSKAPESGAKADDTKGAAAPGKTQSK